MKTVGTKIKAFRDSKKLSQTELAAKLGIGQTTLGDIESGYTKKIDFQLMYKICKEFDVDLEYFILDEPLGKIESNQGKIDENATNGYENIMEQIKTLIEDCKQKEFRIKHLEAKILSLQKQIIVE